MKSAIYSVLETQMNCVVEVGKYTSLQMSRRCINVKYYAKFYADCRILCTILLYNNNFVEHEYNNKYRISCSGPLKKILEIWKTKQFTKLV